MSKNKINFGRSGMSDNVKSLLVVALAVVFVFVIFAVLEDDEKNYEKVDYSSYSTGDGGVKALYLSALEYGRQAGFNVEKYNKYSRFLSGENIVVFVNPYLDFLQLPLEIEEIRRQIQNGSVYIMIMDDEFNSWDRFLSVASTEFMSLTDGYEIEASELLKDSNYYGWKHYRGKDTKGMLFAYDGADALVNSHLKSEKDNAVDLIMLIESICRERNIENVYFNEFSHNIKKNPTVDIIGIPAMLFIAELCILLIILCMASARRFGAPAIVKASVKRDENENVFALANLYRRTRSINLAFDIHMEALIEDIAAALGFSRLDIINRSEVLNAARKDKRMQLLGVDKLIAEYEKAPKARRNIKKMILQIDKIREELNYVG